MRRRAGDLPSLLSSSCSVSKISWTTRTLSHLHRPRPTTSSRRTVLNTNAGFAWLSRKTSPIRKPAQSSSELPKRKQRWRSMGLLLFFFSAWDTAEIVGRLCIYFQRKGATFAFLSRAWRSTYPNGWRFLGLGSFRNNDTTYMALPGYLRLPCIEFRMTLAEAT